IHNNGRKHMRKLLATTCLAVGIGAWAAAPAAAECGDVNIVAMNWQSAEVLAALDAYILREGYGCNATIISGDTVPSITSMVEKGEPDVAPEGWIDLAPELIERGLAENRLVKAAVAI